MPGFSAGPSTRTIRSTIEARPAAQLLARLGDDADKAVLAAPNDRRQRIAAHGATGLQSMRPQRVGHPTAKLVDEA
jgi:hypothetical protein